MTATAAARRLGVLLGLTGALTAAAADLDLAQRQKLDLICRKTAMARTDHVLDIGCGYGIPSAWLMEINPAAEALYGVPRADFLEKRRSIFDFVHANDREKVLSHYNNLFEEGIGELVYRVTGPNREIRWVLDYGRVEYLEGGKVRRVNHILEDITREKMAEDALRESEAWFRSVVETSPGIISELDLHGRFRYVSPIIESIMGYTPADVVGRSTTRVRESTQSTTFFSSAAVSNSTSRPRGSAPASRACSSACWRRRAAASRRPRPAASASSSSTTAASSPPARWPSWCATRSAPSAR